MGQLLCKQYLGTESHWKFLENFEIVGPSEGALYFQGTEDDLKRNGPNFNRNAEKSEFLLILDVSKL